MSATRPIRFWHVALVGATLVLAGCEKAPPGQTTLPREEMTGIATAGPDTGAGEFVTETSARGNAGRPRTAFGSRTTQQYAVSLTDLEGPYALTALVHGSEQDARLYSLAAAPGTANITPLTHLLFAQLYGQDPAAAFQAFGPGGADPSRITTAGLQEAQHKLIAFIGEELQLAIPDTLGNFVTTPFQPAVGNPMYDNIAALSQKLETLNMTLPDFTIRVARAARLCLVEQVAVTIDGTTAEFCPQTKSATLSEDETHLDYLFTDRHGSTLTVVVAGEAVLSAHYDNTEEESWSCTGSACAAISLQAPAEDETRVMHFDALTLTGDGNLTIDGTLTGAIPGVPLPVLPCDANRYFVVFPDSEVVATCVNTDPYGFGMNALFGNQMGVAPSRVQYDFDSLDGLPTRPRLSVLTEANDAPLALQFVDYEPDTYTPRRTYACKLGCNGVTLGPVTVNTDILGSDPPILIRTVTLRNTMLQAYDADGNETGDAASVTASLNTAYYDFATASGTPIVYPQPGSCAPQYASVDATAGSTRFDLCLTPSGLALVQTNGDVVLVAGNYETDGLRVVLRAGMVIQTSIKILNQPLGFVCSNDCAGINVSAPDANGLRTLQFGKAVLREAFLDSLTGPRSVKLDGGTLIFQAQIPQP